MNDYQMIHLASSRSHDFHQEALQQRLAKSIQDQERHGTLAHAKASSAPISTLRLTLNHLLSRTTA